MAADLALKFRWVDRLPSVLWLLLPVVALMPVWLWCAARLRDGSDDPFGIVALAALALVVARDRRFFSERPRALWLLFATLLAVAAVVDAGLMPPLARGVLAVLSVCALLMALRSRAQPMLALTGLALLALPLLSSLQFFAGFPLRVLTAEGSRLLLSALGVAATREGTTLAVAGRLVMVDAPCSGIQMGWAAYFTACAVAAWWRVPDGRFLRRVPLVGVAVLVGNILRNTLLVAKEAQLVQWPEWTHDAVGLAAFAGVCLFVLWHVGRAITPERTDASFDLRFGSPARRGIALGTLTRLFALATLVALMLWPWLRPAPPASARSAQAIEWPRELDGRGLRPLALSAVEQRFADRFPGVIARFTDGEGEIVLRQVDAPTRMLHPATDCYRGLGYRVKAMSLEQDASPRRGEAAKLSRCFIAEKAGVHLRVCERIVDARGQGFTDTSAWYWAAVMGRTHGPWRAITRARAL